MSSIRNRLTAALICAPLLLQAQTVPTGGMAATQALLAGDMQAAQQLALAALAADPQDRAALVALAGASVQTGTFDAGYQAARQAFRMSVNGLQRYEAARLAALLAARGDRFLLARFWLRRALISAPGPEAVAQTGEDIRLLRNQGRLTFGLQFAFAPSDNVNGGAESRYNVIDGFPFVGLLSPDAQALSGWSGTIDARLSYRLRQSQTSRTTLEGHLNARGVLLSQESRDFIADQTDPGDPAITNSDFSAGVAELGLSHVFALRQGMGQADLTFGRGFSGEDEVYGFTRVQGIRRWQFSADQGLEVMTRAEWRQQDGAADELRQALQATWHQGLPAGRLDWTLGLSRNLSDSINAQSRGWTAQVAWSPAARLGPAELGLSVGFQFTDYPDYRVIFPVPGGRQDNRRFASISAALPDQAWAGFMPVLSLGWDGVDSNVSRFSHDGVSVDLSFRSSF